MPEIPCIIAAHAASTPDAPALVGATARYTYRDLDAAITTVAENLRALNVSRGDCVALYLAQDLTYPILVLGILRLGAIAAPLNTRTPPTALTSIFAATRCVLVITDNEELLAAAAPAAPTYRAPMFLASIHNVTVHAPRVTTERPAVIVMTSGSTGQPKPAVLTYGNLLANARLSNANLPLAPGDAWLLSLPLYHVSGLGVVFRCIAAGAAMVVPAPTTEIAHALNDPGVTHVSLVATQLARSLRDPEQTARLASLKAILLGGSALPASLLQDALRRQLPIYITYGLTETASQVATSRLRAWPDDQRPTARALELENVRINADSEIEVRGPTLFSGYLDRGALDLSLTEDGWFRTGDSGTMDADGNLVVHGRIDNMFISGGENIQPEEIEAALYRLDGVAQAVVAPIPDDEFGRRPVAFIEMAPGHVLRPETLSDGLARVLPRYKIPVLYFDWPTDIAAPGLKISRKQFTERAIHETQKIEKNISD